MKTRLGFSMVEIVVALIILTIGFFPIYNLFRQGTQGTKNNIDETVATNYASDLINFCKDLRYSDIHNIKGDDLDKEFKTNEEIVSFFKSINEKLEPPPKINEAGFNRSMKIKEYGVSFWNNLFQGIGEMINDIIYNRKKVPAYMIEVTVTFPKMGRGSGKKSDQDKVILYSIILD